MHRAKRTRTHVPTLFDLGVFSLRIYVTFLSVFGCAVYVDDYGKLDKEMGSPKHTHTHTQTNKVSYTPKSTLTHTHTHTNKRGSKELEEGNAGKREKNNEREEGEKG